MKKEICSCLLVLVAVFSSFGEQYRLKTPATVDIIENGEVVGVKRLKVGVVLQPMEEKTEADTAIDKGAGSVVKKGGKLIPSKISVMMFKNTQPASAVFRAKIELNDGYYGPFDGKEKSYWSIYIRAYDSEWNDSERLDGYLSKASAVGKKLITIIQDGKEHACHVKVRPVKCEDSRDYVTIEDFELVDSPE